MVFVVAVLLRPEVQTMAQKELDAVTRRERLPTFEDRLKLPFVDAICKEVIRWKPVTPLSELLPRNRRRKIYDDSGVPRATSENGVYNGFFVPKGW
jgi:cytochrome P450